MYLVSTNNSLGSDWAHDAFPAYGSVGQTARGLVDLQERSSSGTITEKALSPRRDNAHNLGELLHRSRVAAKLQINNVAMWLGEDWRVGLSRQLDSLLDEEEWELGDALLSSESFSYFLRSILILKPTQRPGLALSLSGNLITTWKDGVNQLIVEYLPSGRVEWLVTNRNADEIERVAGISTSERMATALNPYNARNWFRRAYD